MEMKALPMIILALVASGLLIGIGVMLFDEFGDASKIDVSINDENLTILNGSYHSLDYYAIKSGTASYTFKDNATAIPAAAFTLRLPDGAVTLTEYPQYNGTEINISYTYEANTSTVDVMHNYSVGFDDFATWMTVLVVISAAGIVMFYVLRAFGER